MKKVIVIGGGFAGLTAAAHLSNSNYKVELIEASKKLGGRAYSLTDEESNSIIDNGQHILMGCYKETLNFIDLIGARNNFIFQNDLEVNFLKKNNQLFPLKATLAPYPLNLFFGLLNYEAISFYERFLLLKFFAKINFYADAELNRLTVKQWLLIERQTENIIKSFWEILAIGALNTSIDKASAKIFADILKQIFFRGKEAAAIILPKFGLTESYCKNAIDFIEKNNGRISSNETVKRIKYEDKKATKIITDKRELSDFDFVVSAIPHYAVEKILSEVLVENFKFQYSAILSIHIWLKKNTLNTKFYGLIDSKIHWIFIHDDHITLVTSDANDLMTLSHEELFETAANELEKFAGIKKDQIISYKIIKEKRATFIPDNQILKKRSPAKTKFSNLFLAGDWTDTGLPSTIESASKSGRIAFDEIELSKD